MQAERSLCLEELPVFIPGKLLPIFKDPPKAFLSPKGKVNFSTVLFALDQLLS